MYTSPAFPKNFHYKLQRKAIERYTLKFLRIYYTVKNFGICICKMYMSKLFLV